jgi:hypothetical protein
MTASEQKTSPDFFENHDLDPVSAATRHSSPAVVQKRKAGFYLNTDLLERFNRCFHRLKLADIPIENKSALVELALQYALEDLEQGDKSLILKKITAA